MRIEKLRLAMEEDPDERNVARFTRAEEEFRHRRRLRRRERGPRASPPASASAPTASTCRSACCRAASAAASSSPASCSPAATCCCSTSRPTTSTSTPRTWLLGFLRAYRGALLVISHDLDLLDEAITRVLHLDRATEDATGTIVEYKGTYTPVPRGRGPRTRSAWPRSAAQQAKEIDRLQTLVDRFGAKATKAAMAHSIEKRIARLEADQVEAPDGRPRRCACGSPSRRRRARPCSRPTGWPRPTAGRRCSRTSTFDLGRGERLLVLGLNGAGKTSLLRILAGETEADLGDVEFGHDVSAGYYAQEHEGNRAGRTLLDNIRDQAAGSPTPSCAACSACSG